jgi:hypothetical protein
MEPVANWRRSKGCVQNLIFPWWAHPAIFAGDNVSAVFDAS